MRALGVSGARRSPALPDMPSIREAGIPFAQPSWSGLVGAHGDSRRRAQQAAYSRTEGARRFRGSKVDRITYTSDGYVEDEELLGRDKVFETQA